MEKWTNKIPRDKLITRIAICAVALLCLFFLFSCKGSDQHMSLPDTCNDTINTTTDSITVIDDKAEETANSTGLEETTDTTETIEEVEEVEEPVNDTVIDTLSQPDTTNVIK